MFLLELVLQGVRGFKDLARLRFQSGFNFISAGNESGKTASVDSILRLLFPNGQADRFEALVSKDAPDTSRAALVVCANDGLYYRVIQDFSKKAVNLSKYNAGTKDFVLLQKDWDGAANFMSGMAAGISEEDYGSIFILRKEHYSGRRARSAPVASAAPRQRHFSPPAPAAAKSANETRIAELREILRKADEAGNVEYELEAAKIKLGDTAKKLEDLEEINVRYADLDSRITDLQACEALPENIAELAAEHEQRQKQIMGRSDELHNDIEGLKVQIDGIQVTPLWKDKILIAGVAVGLLSLFAGLFGFLKAEQADYFPIGILVSLGIIAAAWYRGSRRNAQRKVLFKEIEALEAEVAEIEKGFETGGSGISEYMKATGSATLDEFRDKAHNFRHFKSLRDDVAAERKRLLGDVPPDQLMSEYNRLQQEVIGLEKAHSAVAHNAVEVYSVRQEIERLESEAGGAYREFGGFFSEEPMDFTSSFAQATSDERYNEAFFPELLAASRVVGIELDTLLPAVQTAAQRNFSAVTSGRYVRVDIGHEGDCTVYNSSDARVDISELSHGAKAQLYLCLRAGLVEAISGKLRLPFVLDDPISSFDPARQTTACQMLRGLGAKTQVLLFTSNPSLRAEGDTFAELK